jgi:tRNA dimethylallyltransferase
VTTTPTFLAVTGPTASGKTDLSLALAERIPAEIVSMDSRQVYIGMDVGTDKVDASVRRRVPHHGLDLVRPNERYSAGHFARDVRRWTCEIRGRDCVPLLVGGTGFFLRAVTDPIFAEPAHDESRLRALRAYLRGQGAGRLAAWVRRLDPERAELAIQGGPQRMSRTIEVALLSGTPLSTWHREAPPDAEGLPGVVVVLDLPRDMMDRRIDDRVTRMVERGLVDEVRALLDAGYLDEDPGMSGAGYREISACLRGEVSLEEAMEQIRRSTRQYARRQLTWFRNQLPESAVRIDATVPIEVQVEAVLEAWHAAGADTVNNSRHIDGGRR